MLLHIVLCLPRRRERAEHILVETMLRVALASPTRGLGSDPLVSSDDLESPKAECEPREAVVCVLTGKLASTREGPMWGT